MDTYDQFRQSERRTFWFRSSAAAFALVAPGVIPGAEFSIMLAAVIAALTAAVLVGMKRLLPRYRSDAWIYGQLGADTVLAAGMLYVYGPASPALAWPVFNVTYYSLLLGRHGAAAATVAGLAADIVALAGHPSAFPSAFLLTCGVLGGAAVVSSLLAVDRFTERARRTELEDLLAHEARSSRVLAGLMRMANAHGDREVAAALADAIRAASQFPAAVSFVTRPSDNALVPISWHLDSGEAPAAGKAVELAESETPGAIAARMGAAIVLDGPADLPNWARDLGFTSGLVLPVTRGMELLGIVYALSRTPSVASVSEIEQLELVAAFAARMFAGTPTASAPAAGMLDSLLARRASEQTETLRQLSLPGINLDPAKEHVEINGVNVSLSKTEFALFHALASDPGRIFEAQALAETCWEGETPNVNAVDVTIYRLRRKLARVPGGQELIQTVRGRGYVLQSPVASGTRAIGG